jgi:propionate CoA-transferase
MIGQWEYQVSEGTRRTAMKIIDVDKLRDIIPDGASLATAGFSKSGMPEYIYKGIEDSFLECGHPRDLIYNATALGGTGEPDTFHDRFGPEGLVADVRVSHIQLSMRIRDRIDAGKMPGHFYPLGVMAQIYRAIGAGKPGVISKVGLGTFIDPRLEGGRMNSITEGDVARLMEIDGEEWLFYPVFDLDVGIIRATCADTKGNISLWKEPCLSDAFQTAQAVKKCGGTVIVQVEEVVEYGEIPAREVEIPGFMVDYVIVAPEEFCKQTPATDYDPSFCQKERVELTGIAKKPLDIRKIIARRAIMELKEGDMVNLGYGIPEVCGDVAAEEGIADRFTLTVECGLMGGVPASGLDFGAARNVDYVTDMVGIMDWYDGGGLDISVLGLAEVDVTGNLNVTRFGLSIGPGGFINITTGAKENVFCGAMTNGGLAVAAEDGKLRILQEGRKKKFVNEVEQISFNAGRALAEGHTVKYITERAVFELDSDGLVLTEIAPGIDLKTQVLDQMEFEVRVSDELKEMDPRIFVDQPMGI